MKNVDVGLYDQFMDFIKNKDQGLSVPVVGVWDFEVKRFDGTVEHRAARNTLTSAGLNQLAALGCVNASSAFIYLAIGTQTAASSLGSTQAGMGEVSRKAAAIAANSNESIILVMTWAGATDSMTSLDLRTAGAFNHASSGSGVALNFVNSVATVLADSDFLKVTMAVRVGSHAL